MDLISEFYGGYRFFGHWSSPQKYGGQLKVYTREDVIRCLNRWNGIHNCGISMCTFKEDIPHLLYLPFDFDSDDKEKSRQDADKLYNYLVDEGWDVTLNDSAFRGYHCYITVMPDYYTRWQIKNAQTFYKDILNLKTMDPQLFGDIRRLMRIPGSLHAGKFKKIKGKGWQRMGEGSVCRTIAHNKGEMMDLNEYWEDDMPEINYNGDNVSNGKFKNRPCVVLAMDEKEPGQLIRYSNTVYLLKAGRTPEEILEMYEERHSDGKKYEWDDWDREYTWNQIMHIATNIDKYHPMICDSLKELGYCFKECPYNYKYSLKRASDLNG